VESKLAVLSFSDRFRFPVTPVCGLVSDAEEDTIDINCSSSASLLGWFSRRAILRRRVAMNAPAET
jgi:hypothetical protein